MGNVWLKCLLANIYDLKPVGPKRTPERPQFDLFKEWVNRGGYPDGTIFHQHYEYSDDFVELAASLPAHIVTIVRDPYDAFLASYHAVQGHAGDDGRKARRSDVLIGKPLDHPDVLAYLRQGGFRNNMIKAKRWLESGQALIVRYEDLFQDPMSALQQITAQIHPVDSQRIERAIAACEADKARESSGGGVADGSRDQLTDAHLAIFAEQHGDLIASLGYDLRPPSGAAIVQDDDSGASPEEAMDDDLFPPVENTRWRYAKKGGREGFVQLGDYMVQRFVEYAGFGRDERVLDVGSGVGRVALALTKYLDPQASYDGFDVDAASINWCQENVTPRYPQFRFHVADVYHAHYNPEGTQSAVEYRFPFPDNTFSFVFLASVFTHLLPDTMENYVREISRVLEPGGRCLVTILLLNDVSLADIDRGASPRRFAFHRGNYRIDKEEQPELAVAYDEAYVRRVFPESGLTIVEPIHYEGWSKRKITGEGHQDMIVATKRP